jgi:TonB family protein
MGYQALLFCPDEKLARVVTQVLSDLDFSVETATEPFAAVKKLMAQHYDAVVVDCDNEQNATLLFKSARNSSSNQSSLAVAVVEGQAGVAKAFRIGANLVLTKPINVEQAKGTLRVARGLLRKGGDTKAPAGAKPAAAPATKQTAQPPRPASNFQAPRPVAPAAKKLVPPVFTEPKPPAAIPVPAASAGPLEVENDPTPDLDAADAAMLESLHDPVVPSTATATKNFAWQPAKTHSSPMASALHPVAEAAGKTLEPSQPKTQPIVAERKTTPPVGRAGSAAAAPAMAKDLFESTPGEATVETAAPATKQPADARSYSEPEREVSAPSFSAYSAYGMDDDAEEGSKSKKPYFIVVAIVIAAAMAFYGWTTKHSSSPAPAPVAPAAPTPVETTPSQTSPGASVPSQNSQPVAAEPLPVERETVSPHAMKPGTSSKGALVAEDTVTKLAPIIVKRDATTHQQTPTQSEPVPQAPGALSIASGSGNDTALSSLVTNTPVSVPNHAPQTLRISQGVSQGLILKRVQPVYPAQAMQMRVQGAVQLLATISKEGQISNLSILSGDSILARAATDAVRQWKYKPYYLNGEPVEIQTQITVNFKLPN